ncbi:hypothetical protein MKW92_051319 [Papaver armeniacum]|nr:hypothetical protein MKW92_021364 [Papaver armeniacum]KAI3930063.1 hypothetical protein MKW92_051319 [Papaver armeniacum]
MKLYVLFLQNIILFYYLLIVFLCYHSSSELITSLPGQPINVSFKQHSGYIVTDAQQGRALFYYFVEANSVDPLSRPLTLWLNGGPGCSSLGFGAFMEHGPFQPDKNGFLINNKYSWNLESNMLYVESPIGVGFSYSNTSSNYILWNDTTTAEDNAKFIVNWLEEFPEFKDSDLYLTGESYAGHYIPQLAALLLEYNKQPNIKPINLKAIALGNPLLDLDISVNAADYLWSHGAISDATLKLEKTVCNDSRFLREYVHEIWTQECNDVFNIVGNEIGVDIDRSDLLLPQCLSSPSSSSARSVNSEQFKSKGKLAAIHATLGRRGNIGDPCLVDRIFSYLNKPQVQKALHANTTHLPSHWDFCSRPLVYQEDNLDMNLIPIVSNLIRDGIPVMLYSGDQDTKIPLTQTRIIANMLAQNLNLTSFTKYAPWFHKKQVGGWAQSFGALKDGKNVTYLTFATVRGAAHEVPFTSPSQALTLFKAFISGTPL